LFQQFFIHFYYVLNEVLRKRNQKEIEPWLGYIYYLYHALDKLPNQDLTIYRGVDNDEINEIYRGVDNDEINEIYKNDSLVGQSVIWSGFTSGTKNLKISQNFATKKGLIF
jgi:hypothetical protein